MDESADGWVEDPCPVVDEAAAGDGDGFVVLEALVADVVEGVGVADAIDAQDAAPLADEAGREAGVEVVGVGAGVAGARAVEDEPAAVPRGGVYS